MWYLNDTTSSILAQAKLYRVDSVNVVFKFLAFDLWPAVVPDHKISFGILRNNFSQLFFTDSEICCGLLYGECVSLPAWDFDSHISRLLNMWFVVSSFGLLCKELFSVLADFFTVVAVILILAAPTAIHAPPKPLRHLWSFPNFGH